MTTPKTTDNTPSIWEWKNTAHITKTGMQIGFALALLVPAALVALKVISLASLVAFLTNPLAILALASIFATYFIVNAVSSYQQMKTNEVRGKDDSVQDVIIALKADQGFTDKVKGGKGDQGVKGKDADFTDLVGDVLKKGQIVENAANDGLELKLLAADYNALTTGKNANDDVSLHVVLTDKTVEVKFNHGDGDANADRTVALTNVGGKDQIAEMKTALDDNLAKDLTIFNGEEAVQTVTTNVILQAAAAQVQGK